jgi:hypothetical protein
VPRRVHSDQCFEREATYVIFNRIWFIIVSFGSKGSHIGFELARDFLERQSKTGFEDEKRRKVNNRRKVTIFYFAVAFGTQTMLYDAMLHANMDGNVR